MAKSNRHLNEPLRSGPLSSVFGVFSKVLGRLARLLTRLQKLYLCLLTVANHQSAVTMSLKQQIDADVKEAMKARDQDRLRALRAVKSMILLEETKEGATGGDLKPEDEIKLLSKAVKQRKDSADIYRQQNRADLLVTEEAEIAVIEKYLPQQLTEDELRAAVQAIIAQTGATGPGDMGKVMGAATKALAGKAEGKAVSAMVKSLL